VNHSKAGSTLPPDASAAIGKLIVRMQNEGLFTSDDVRRTLRAALMPAATALQASLLETNGFLQSMREAYLAAE
jgi:hypothetical protein